MAPAGRLRSRCDPFADTVCSGLSPYSPIGRGSRLKIDSVWVRVPLGGPEILRLTYYDTFWADWLIPIWSREPHGYPSFSFRVLPNRSRISDISGAAVAFFT